MTEHRVRFVKLLDTAGDDIGTEAEFLRELFLLLSFVRNEFVKRWIDESDGYRETIHGFEDADEVATLEWQKLI